MPGISFNFKLLLVPRGMLGCEKNVSQIKNRMHIKGSTNKMFQGWGEIFNENSSPNRRGTVHVARMGSRRKWQKILVGKLGRDETKVFDVAGKTAVSGAHFPGVKWPGGEAIHILPRPTLIIYLKDKVCECGDWINLAQDRVM